MAQNLLADFEHLSQRTQALCRRCADLTALLINRVMMAEAARGIVQNERIARLTVLAFLFVPVAFTSSFFGINFAEFVDEGGPRLSVYVWFLVSLPLFLRSAAYCFWGSVRRILHLLTQWDDYLFLWG